MTTKIIAILALLLTSMINCSEGKNNQILEEDSGDHLFIFSGQSNMARFKPELVFQPIVEKEFGKDNVIIVKEAKGGQPIYRWYKMWKSATGEVPDSTGDLYEILMEKVKAEIKDKKLGSVSFFWMQGERDAKDSQGEVYLESLWGILEQLRNDLNYQDINFICGRLSDYGMDNVKYPHWTMIRNIQETFANDYVHGAWIDTDDLNDGVDSKGIDRENALHYTPDGYNILAERYAENAIRLIYKK